MEHSQICIAGAGIIGLSLALELHARGRSVVVIDSGPAMQQASTAAAGMLAADDPHNPAEISALSHLSLSLYPAFLARIESLSGATVPFQTRRTLQALAGNPALTIPEELRAELLLDDPENTLGLSSGFSLLTENSVNPRQLAAALIAAVGATRIRTVYHSPVVSTSSTRTGVLVETQPALVEAEHFVDCTGAWAGSYDPDTAINAVPIKGQMLALAMPPDFLLKTTLRTEDIYILPRTIGSDAGRAIIGATVEDVGFDKSVDSAAIKALHRRAVSLVPELAHANVVESWAGLRPATPDRLPIIGPHTTRPRHWFATGHYRNGILLAPATASTMADLLCGEPPVVEIDSFSPSRFADARVHQAV